MVALAMVACALCAAAALLDRRLVSLNRSMPLADFEERNPFARQAVRVLGEGAGWKCLQLCGLFVFSALAMITFLFPWIALEVVGIFVAYIAVILFDLLHDGREVSHALAEGYRLGSARRTR